MSTIRTDAGQAPVDVSKQLASAPQKKVVGSASTTIRVNAAGIGEGTSEQFSQTAAIVPE